MKRSLLNMLALSVLLVSCDDKKDDLDGPRDDNSFAIASSKEQPGIGENDDLPLGTALSLPEGVRLVHRRHHRFNPDISKLYAHTNFFYVDLNFVNDRMPGTPPVYVELPPGIVGVSIDHDKQNGLSIERYLIPVPPTERIGGGRDTTTIYVGMACLNASRSMPWYDNSPEEMRYPISRNNYQQFLVTRDPNLLKLLDLLKGHAKLRVAQHWDPVEAHEEGYVVPEWMKIYNEIQDYIWAVTDGHGLTKEEVGELQRKLRVYR